MSIAITADLTDNLKKNKVTVNVGELRQGGIQDVSFISFSSTNSNKLKTDSLINIFRGIPQLNPTYCCSDQNRMFMQITLDDEQESIKNIINFLTYLDTYFDSDATKTKLFGSKKDKYTYETIIKRSTICDDDNSGNNSSLKKIPYVKLAFRKNKNSDGINLKLLDTKSGQTLSSETVTDVCTHLKFKRPFRLSFTISHIWATKHAGMGGNKMYGVKLLIDEIEVNTETQSNKTIFVGNDLLDMLKNIRKNKYVPKSKTYIEI